MWPFKKQVEPKPVVFCVNCKHHKVLGSSDICQRWGKTEKLSLVDGKCYDTTRRDFCSSQRGKEYAECWGGCGPDADYFESKDTVTTEGAEN